MPAKIEAVKAYATVEDICTALRDVYGIYEEPAFFIVFGILMILLNKPFSNVCQFWQNVVMKYSNGLLSFRLPILIMGGLFFCDWSFSKFGFSNVKPQICFLGNKILLEPVK
jgi:hypothetical protein